MATSDPSWWRRRARRSAPRARGGDGPQVALVTGCPRSGTTAVLNWLGSQPGVIARDESRRLVAAHHFLDAVDRFAHLHAEREHLLPSLRATLFTHPDGGALQSARLLVEKEPLERIAFPDGRYADFLRHVRELVPEVRILFMLRHPVATISSMRARRWGYSLASGALRDVSLEEAIATWRANAALLHTLRSDPAVQPCHYDQMAAEPRETSRTAASHLGLHDATPFVPSASRPLILTPDETGIVLESTAEEREWFAM